MNADGVSKTRRYCYIRKILERPGPFCHPDFEPSPETFNNTLIACKMLVIGAGGLGCELLKNLGMMGFRDIHVIDMDTIDLSNLNRQFLFRRKDVGKSKAEVAAEFINKRIPGCNVVPHFNKIQEFDEDFYRQFNLVICGLDSIIARRWINGMLVSMLCYDDNGELDSSSIIPVIDGGTEGFKGNARVILPGMTACVECTLDLFPPQVVYPLCTIASTPRLPEHCIEYVKILQWPKETPFEGAIDGDDPSHISWIYEKAQERASQFGISGVTYRLVQGVVKNIIPAVASTNAVIAAACVTECFKFATGCCSTLNNYMVFNDVDGIYTYTYEAERKEDCIVCSPSTRPKYIEVPHDGIKLSEFIDILSGNKYQMKSPAIVAEIDGKNRTLYMSTIPSIEQRTRDNLKKSLKDLNLFDNCMLLVTDLTNPSTIEFILRFSEIGN